MEDPLSEEKVFILDVSAKNFHCHWCSKTRKLWRVRFGNTWLLNDLTVVYTLQSDVSWKLWSKLLFTRPVNEFSSVHHTRWPHENKQFVILYKSAIFNTESANLKTIKLK
jgi:hypothetical protein